MDVQHRRWKDQWSPATIVPFRIGTNQNWWCLLVSCENLPKVVAITTCCFLGLRRMGHVFSQSKSLEIVNYS